MKIPAEELLTDLIDHVNRHLMEAERLKQLPLETLNFKAGPEIWSALECIEHLNRYGDFYLPEIEQKLNESTVKPTPFFKSSLLGNYFAKAMLPKEKLKKMKTFKDKNPNGSKLDKNAIDRFIDQQKIMLGLLDKARHTNLTKIKTTISISTMLKLRLGDTFRLVIYHNERHLTQANRAIVANQG